MKKIKIAVAGASGFVGRYLIEALIKRKYQVIALSRKKRTNENKPYLEWIQCDLFSRKDSQAALSGCDMAVYLTHSMIPSARLSQGTFSDYDLILSDNFSRAAKKNSLKKIIYFELLRGQDCVESKNMTSAQRKSTMISLNSSIIQVGSFKCRADVPLADMQWHCD